jgi:tetratricopeptide (TPR) repeat protein
MDGKIRIEQAYTLFGIDRSASAEKIKAIYRQKAKEIHPDLHPEDPHARDRFTTLNQAYQLLLSALNSDSSSGREVRDPIDRTQVSVNVEPPLSPQDLQLKQEIFASVDKLIRQEDFAKAVATIDLLVKVIPNSAEISQKQSAVYFLYARSLINCRRQFNLARTYLKLSLKLDPKNQKHWEAVNREFNRIERFTT